MTPQEHDRRVRERRAGAALTLMSFEARKRDRLARLSAAWAGELTPAVHEAVRSALDAGASLADLERSCPEVYAPDQLERM